jgi:ABC-type branched-subunit amino acid transport system permease subunit
MLPEVLRFVGLSSELAAQTRLLVFGLVLMYLMHAKPTGLFGKYLP